ncbi:unnamed protein product, partial [Mesorhabditis spiculigera]
MDNLQESFRILCYKIADEAFKSKDLQRLSKSNGCKVDKKTAGEIRERHLQQFLTGVMDDFSKTCSGEEIEAKIARLADIREEAIERHGADAQGYRPVGDPRFDTLGIQMKCKEAYCARLQEEIEALDERIGENKTVNEQNTRVVKQLAENIKERLASKSPPTD